MLREVAAMPGPIHIHIAEQPREVAECLEATGARPVQWLLDSIGADRRWCLIHATHMTEAETRALAASGAIAGLCPSTEASLGDGIFPLAAYLAAGGAYGIGTDSHVGTAAREELRLLEYGQRLTLGARAVVATEASPHPGRCLLDGAFAGGEAACGRPIGAIAPGRRCDLVVLDTEHPTLIGQRGDALLDAFVFSGQQNPIHSVIVGGRRVVEAGRHIARAEIEAAYARSIRRLLG
jgi:formimidoylglutamate deiminase